MTDGIRSPECGPTLQLNRRAWLAHCSVLVLAGGFAGVQAQAKPVRILVVGDSLSAEYGIARGRGWVALLEQKLKAEGLAAQVVNASISGDTTSGGRSRLPPLLLNHKPTHVVIELGGNDALRGLPLDVTRRNLNEMVSTAKTAGARVLLVGMRMPPNYGRQYGDDFIAVFEAVAQQQNVPLVPFLLKGVADAPNAERLFQADRIHPSAEAHPAMLNNVWPALRPLLKS